MKIQIKSREAIEKLANERPFPPKTALISITDCGFAFAALTHKPDFLLQTAFDDVDRDILANRCGQGAADAAQRALEEKYHMLTDAQAAKIASFYFSVRDKAEVLICQCEHGQSRSAAVAAAILEYRCRKGIRVFADDRYYPNKTVFQKVLRALRAQDKA